MLFALVVDLDSREERKRGQRGKGSSLNFGSFLFPFFISFFHAISDEVPEMTKYLEILLLKSLDPNCRHHSMLKKSGPSMLPYLPSSSPNINNLSFLDKQARNIFTRILLIPRIPYLRVEYHFASIHVILSYTIIIYESDSVFIQ